MVQLFEIEAFSVYWLLRRGRLHESTKRLSAQQSLRKYLRSDKWLLTILLHPAP